jgi:hypothetical protein
MSGPNALEYEVGIGVPRQDKAHGLREPSRLAIGLSYSYVSTTDDLSKKMIGGQPPGKGPPEPFDGHNGNNKLVLVCRAQLLSVEA